MLDESEELDEQVSNLIPLSGLFKGFSSALGTFV